MIEQVDASTIAALGSVFDELNVGLVAVEPGIGLANVNQSAAALLGVPAGNTTAAAFELVVDDLIARALNQAEVTSAIRDLETIGEFKSTWVFADAPTHLGVVAKPAPFPHSNGRLWAFYDNSFIAQAIDAAEQAGVLIRASSDSMLDPQVILEAVRRDDGVVADLVYRDANEAACAYFGESREQLIGRTVRASVLKERYMRCAVTGEPVILDAVEYRGEDVEGGRFHDVRATQVSSGLIALTWRDVTDRVELSQQIAVSEESFRLLAENMADVVLRLRNGRIDWISNSVEDALGAPVEQWVGRPILDLVAPDRLDSFGATMEELEQGRTFLGRTRIRDAEGTLHWVHLHVKPFHGPHDTPDGLVASFRVIDDEVAAEERANSEIARRDAQNRSLTRRLQEQTGRLMSELNTAARYVRAILPGDLDGPVQVDSRYVPSRELGGDIHDYRWIDDDHLIVYLLDVSGHGVGPSMVSVSVHNLLRSGSLPRETLLQPARVLTELNRLFPMEQHDGNYFTAWYGIYQASTRELRFASAGHPPALAFTVGSRDPVTVRLHTPTMPIGVFDDTEYFTGSYTVPPDTELLLISDGVYELTQRDGRPWSLPNFVKLCTHLAGSAHWSLDELIAALLAISATGLFEDDCTVVRLRIP